MMGAGHPGGQVHAVGHVPDRHRFPVPIGPELPPDVARDLTVPPGHAVHPGGEPHGRHRHVKLARQGGVGAQAEQRLAVYAHLLPHRSGAGLELVGGERVVARRHRGVGGEDAVGPHLLDGVVVGDSRRPSAPGAARSS